MRATIPGVLDQAALAKLHFTTLARQEQEQAIRRLAARGLTHYDISHATGLAVEQVRRVLQPELTAGESHGPK